MTAGEPGGTLRDAIARAVSAFHFDGNEPLDRDDFPEADAVLAALREHLSAHPADIEQLGWKHGFCYDHNAEAYRVTDAWIAPAPPVPTHPGEPK